MKLLKRLFLATAIGAVLMLSAFSADCHQLTEEWFGDSGSEVSVLSIAALEPTEPDIESALDAYFSVREAQFTGGGIATYSADGLMAGETDRSALIEELSQRINALILDAEVSHFITELEELENGYRATVYEWTFFDYDDLADGVGGSDTAGFGTTHQITLEYDAAGELVLVSDEYQESDVLTGDTSTCAMDMEEVVEEEMLDTLSAITYDADYDVVKASIYANRWVSKENPKSYDTSYYNPEYQNFVSSGGDCANFVSQCMYAGGMDKNDTWQPYKAAWIYCPAMISHFSSRGNRMTTFTEDDIYPGSIMFYKDYHVVICTGHNSAGTPVINGHTNDRYRMPWDFSKEKITDLFQLTTYEVDNLLFEEDAIVAWKSVKVPLYTHYLNTTQSTRMVLNAGDSYSVVASFDYQGEKWFAYDHSGTIYYGKVIDGTYLKNSAPDVILDTPASVTTNDYLTVTASVQGDEITAANLILTDAGGNKITVAMTCEKQKGTASATVDCQDMKPGTLTVAVECTTTFNGNLSGSKKITVTEASTVSGYQGSELLWTLDKTTGALIIYSADSSTKADWLRFGDKIKTVKVSPDVKALPSDPFAGCTGIRTLYGVPEMEAVAKGCGAEFVLMYFWDVLPDHWAYSQLNDAYEKGLVAGTGDNLFDMDGTMWRASFIAILSRMEQVDQSDMTGFVPFTDVTKEDGSWYYAAVAWAYEQEIAAGTPANTFLPDASITREQAIAFIARYLRAMGYELEDAENPAPQFPDIDDASDYAREDIELLRQKGILSGRDGGMLCPQEELTRVEGACLLVRIFNACQKD